MTWMETFEQNVKAPAIGTPEWFSCIPPLAVEAARALIESKTPVVVQRHSAAADRPAFQIVFDSTEFVAGGFDDEMAAERFAAAWNRSCS